MTKEEEAKAMKVEKRKKGEASKKEDKEKEPSAKMAKKEEKPEPVSIYQTILALERKESEVRGADDDHALWRETCGELRALMKEIFDLKMKKGDSGEISERRIQGSLLFVTLKKLNRLEKLRIKRSRDATNQSKQGVDSFNLQLQNLLYEVLHLKKEVTKCVHFKSADESLTLIPEDQFFKEAPEDISKPEVTKCDPHAMKLARLQWELAKRKELSEEAEKEENERDGLEMAIRQREERLRELQPQLKAVLESTKPVQEYLNLPLDHKRDQNKLARLLPAPLYICYSQVSAFAEASDPLVDVAVRGEEGEAKKWMEEKEEEEKQTEKVDTSRDDEVVEQDSMEDDGESKKKRGKKSSKASAEKEAMLNFHPLSVAIIVRSKSSSEVSLMVTLHLLPALGLVTVRASLTGEGKPVSEVVDPGSLLAHLFQGDTGLTLPPAIQSRLCEADLAVQSLDQLLPGHRAYNWAQKLCGVEFLEELPPSSASSGAPATSRAAVKPTLALLRGRLVARLDLSSQLATLAKTKSTDTLLPPKLAGVYPARVVSKLKVWAGVDWETYSAATATRHLTRDRVVDENDFLYKATCMRDKATMVAYVAVKPSFPTMAPIFCLSLTGLTPRPPDAAPRPPGSPRLQGDSQDASEWVRDFEMELNLNWVDQLPLGPGAPGLLVAQLHRLLAMMDVALEAAAETTENVFAKSQVYFSPIRGRMRRLPLQFCNKTQVFQQR